MKAFYKRNQINIARIAIVSIQLALIRTLATYVYLLHSKQHLAPDVLQMYLTGALTAALACLLLVLLYFMQKYTWAALLALLTIAILLCIKVHYTGFSPG